MAQFDMATEQARVAELHVQAESVLAGLQDKIDAVREAQAGALAVTGEETSRDGSVRAVVDATGVVTALTFAPSAFDRNTPEKLAQATVATIQAAAAKARGRASDALAGVRAPASGMLAAAASAYPDLDPTALSVPAVPRTATDPGEDAFGTPKEQPTSAATSGQRRLGDPDTFMSDGEW
ncbi:MAG TPA: YbaB/EbfC family nucleoid-associated protein [Pseudonocardiaceae bacterium]|jgi:DNA-binding protein YbaB|nr:YbaB/EbfC family nucleoid-associated protein [Pseudonocardiaceae bacterium]